MEKNETIKAMFIFEILGRPAEHVKETISQLVDKLAEFPGIKINNKKIHEPKLIEDEKIKNLFTTFAEVEVFGKNLNAILTIVFNTMPSHVEIIEPNEFRFKNFDLSSLLSELTIKLHRYDEIAKAITIERNILANKLKEMQEKLNVLEKGEEKKSEVVKEKKSKKRVRKKSKKKK